MKKLIDIQMPGERIRYFRKKRNMTQKELAAAIGLGDSAIRNYELGNRFPNEAVILKIAEVLTVDPYLLYPIDITDMNSFMHILMDAEQVYGIRPMIIKDMPVLAIDPSRYVAGNARAYCLHVAVMHWIEEYNKYRDGEYSREEYESRCEIVPTSVKFDFGKRGKYSEILR